ncbi:MAG: glycosyltransferase family 2 protein [Actinobacteria bacterium]|nr:glycosyltransferase family 2 protein [Actinomycetota bacterium]
MSPPALSVVIPAYRSEQSLPPLIDRLTTQLEEIGRPYEIIVVNDASPDGTWEVLQDLALRQPHLTAIDLLGNTGQGPATLCGIERASGSLVITLDDDLQHPPEEIAKLLAALEEHPSWDGVIGSWEPDGSWFRRFGTRVHSRLDRFVYGTPKGFRLTSFRILRRPVVDALVEHRSRTPAINPLILRITPRIHNVDVTHQEQQKASSSFKLRDAVFRVFTNFIQGSTLPLRLMSVFGIIVSILSMVAGSVFLVRWMIGAPTPPGWLSTFLATIFFGGAMLFSVGVLGAYFLILTREMRSSPRWSIRSISSRESGARDGSTPDADRH